MKRILIPVDGSPNSLFAVRQVISEFMEDSAMEIHLLNVQTKFSRYSGNSSVVETTCSVLPEIRRSSCTRI